ncbi:helix-turn-helix domain-containing protein [Halonotius terrestris]|uniref:Helix-turn-helix domain-containing protein n=1 Tax=Halonotius terrestris TaxID=2487750 RepID=A0A8J8PAY9_9EURY|nr:helix-turn-helix domain-containing protein [Halonotius terrestris]TQQ79905.1 helix-turn-helix domain-containing protein [Halonotius terrestris]
MSVITELALPTGAFQLGRMLSRVGDIQVTLETLLPFGDRSVLLFHTSAPTRESFEAYVRTQPSVAELTVVSVHDDRTLYRLDWTPDDHTFLDSVLSLDGHVLEATGGLDTWVFKLRFRSHDAFSSFQEACSKADHPIDVRRIYNPTTPDAGPWHGLTKPQHETLRYAVENGYYSLPREISTQEIADEFGISDQAVSERLRRAIETLVLTTLLPEAEE